MTADDDASRLAADVCAFVDEALVGVEPERDVPRSESLCVRIIERWPDSDAREAGVLAIADALADHLAPRPTEWARALHLVALYLDDIQRDGPGPADGPRPRMTSAGRPVHIVHFHLARALAGHLMARGGSTEIRGFLTRLEEWRAWRVAAEALADVSAILAPVDVAAIVRAALDFGAANMATEELLTALKSGLAAAAAAQDAILDGWAGAEPPFASLDIRVIWLLGLWRLPERADGESMRVRLARQLGRMGDPRASHAALALALRSWPPDTPLPPRRGLMLETLESMGPSGLPYAFAVLGDDPAIGPKGDFEAALDLLEEIAERDDPPSVDAVGGRLLAINQFARALRDQHTPERAERLLGLMPPAGLIPSTLWERLDLILVELVDRHPEWVHRYLLDWLAAHADVLTEKTWPLVDTLPHVWPRLEGRAWLIEAAASADEALRPIALKCLIEPGRMLHAGAFAGPPAFGVPHSGYDGLTPRQVHGLGHLILGHGFVEASIDLLFALARARPDCLDALAPLIGEAAMAFWPGRHALAVERWSAALVADSSDAEKAAVKALEAQIEARAAGQALRASLGPLLFERTHPTAEPVAELLQRQQQQAMRAHTSPLLALATQIPLACGAAFASDDGHAPERVNRLGQFSAQVEVPALDSIDPIEARFGRMYHLSEAARLLSGEERS